MTERRQAGVCIVGAGPAGALVAAHLAERGHDVMILEAGKTFDERENELRMERFLRDEPWPSIFEMDGERDAYVTSGDEPYALNERRVKGVGGSTLHWGGTTPRMHPEDFEMETAAGIGDDWPISYDDLEPYYLEAEWEFGVAGAPNPFGGHRSGDFPMDPHPFSYSDQLFEAACDHLDITLHPLPRAINNQSYDGRAGCEAWGTCSPVCPSGARYTATVHVDRAVEAGAVLIDEAEVQRFEHDGTGSRIERATYVRNGSTGVVEADTFVLAAGPVETPRLLLLSATETHPDGLANRSGLVGRRFMENAAIRVQGRLDKPTRQHLIGFGTSQTQQFYEYHSGPEGSILITPLNNALASPVGATGSPGPTLGQLLRGNIGGNTIWGDELVDTIEDRRYGALAVSAGTELLPDPDNRIALDESRSDNHGNPVPDVQLSIDDHATTVLRRAESKCHEIMEATGAEEIQTSHEPTNPFFANHMSGTTRMGTDPDTSVVTPELQCHELDNLYISGGSVFVTSGPANPTLTIAALALRLAHHLHEDLT